MVGLELKAIGDSKEEILSALKGFLAQYVDHNGYHSESNVDIDWDFVDSVESVSDDFSNAKPLKTTRPDIEDWTKKAKKYVKENVAYNMELVTIDYLAHDTVFHFYDEWTAKSFSISIEQHLKDSKNE